MDAWIWLALMAVFLVIEGVCAIHLVSVWFAAGSLVAAVISMLHGDLWLQILLFFLVSGSLLVLLWPLTTTMFNPQRTKTNVDSVIGTKGYVISAIDNLEARGQVKINGMEWTARSTDGTPISEGTLIRVDRIEGVKVFVTPVSETAKVK